MWLTMELNKLRMWIGSRVHVPKLFVPFVRWVRMFFKDLCNNSNIHGLRYFTERLLHWTERLWWIIAVCVSLWLCSLMIQNILIQWNEKPMTMHFYEKKVSITTVPFPTITICSETKFSKQRFDLSSALKSLSNLSESGEATLNALSHICPLLSKSHTFKENFTSERVHNIIKDIGLSRKETKYLWNSKVSNNLVPVLTEEGLCFTFNALNSHDMYTDEMAPGMMIVNSNPDVSHWSLETGYNKEFVKGEYPFRLINSHLGDVLMIALKIFIQDLETQCTENGRGFKVTLTTPGEVPKVSQSSFRISISERVIIILNPEVTTTSEGLRNYALSQRQCFYNSERRLRFHKIYMQRNCEEECLANFTKQECGCVKFSMPRDKHTKICGAAKVKCYEESERKMLADKSTKWFRDECNCLPACTSVQYKTQIIRTYIDWNTVHKHYNSRELIYIPSFFIFNVGDRNIDGVKRLETYTFTDFLAICGGLLGLFMGISALSLIELIYYFTLRLFWSIRHSRFGQQTVAVDEQSATNRIVFQYIRKIQTFLEEFCNTISIHGVRYFSERRLHSSERLWWLIAFGLSVWLCGSMIRDTWLEWHESPMIMSKIEKKATLPAVPFPALTICANTKTIKQKFDIFAAVKSSHNLNESEMDRINSLTHVCPSLVPVLNKKGFKWRNLYANESIYDTIRDVAPQLDDIFYKCSWQGKVVNCFKLIVPVMTDFGFCFTFNALNSHEIYTNEMAPGMMIAKNNSNVSHWSLSNGYQDEFIEGEYPIRVEYPGKGSAIDIVLQAYERDSDYRCIRSNLGFTFTLTTAGEAMTMDRKPYEIEISEEIQIAIKPKLVTTSDGLRSYGPEQRQCFYQSERQLRFFKLYTRYNCEEECIANYTKLECGCVAFFMPRDSNTKICGEASITCYVNVRVKVISISSNKTYLEECNCLPPCTSIEYNAGADRVKFNMMAIKNVTRLKGDINEGTLQTRLSIYFQNEEVETAKRMERFTFTDFLAICGGLLGLFLGVSVLSIIELLYFFTLRLFWTIRRAKIENAVVPFE